MIQYFIVTCMHLTQCQTEHYLLLVTTQNENTTVPLSIRLLRKFNVNTEARTQTICREYRSMFIIVKIFFAWLERLTWEKIRLSIIAQLGGNEYTKTENGWGMVGLRDKVNYKAVWSVRREWGTAINVMSSSRMFVQNVNNKTRLVQYSRPYNWLIISSIAYNNLVYFHYYLNE